MPPAWDKTASGPSHCATKVSDCAAVYKYLDSQSKALTSYVGSPLWSIVDGPWKLSAFNADGHVTFVPNPKYSGPVKPSISELKMVPYTSEDSAYNALRSGNSVTVGAVPVQDAPEANAQGQPTRAAGAERIDRRGSACGLAE